MIETVAVFLVSGNVIAGHYADFRFVYDFFNEFIRFFVGVEFVLRVFVGFVISLFRSGHVDRVNIGAISRSAVNAEKIIVAVYGNDFRRVPSGVDGKGIDTEFFRGVSGKKLGQVDPVIIARRIGEI